MEREHPLALHVALGGLFGGYGYACFGQTRELGLVVDYQLKGVGGCEQILVEFQVEVR